MCIYYVSFGFINLLGDLSLRRGGGDIYFVSVFPGMGYVGYFYVKIFNIMGEYHMNEEKLFLS